MSFFSKRLSIAVLVVAEIAAMSLWFSSAAVLPDMLREFPLSELRQALLSSGVQAGFVIGAVLVAITGVADRFDPRRVFAVSAVIAAAANAGLLFVPPGGAVSIAIRVVTGAMMAVIYPVGMKIAVGWGTKDRGLLVGVLVGSVTIGSSLPHLVALLGGTAWRETILRTSILAASGGMLALLVSLGPLHARAKSFDPQAIRVAWTNRRIRYAYLGYLGHMWELYVMWAWIGLAIGSSYAASIGTTDATRLAKITAFAAISLGGLASVAAGAWADRIGKARVTMISMALSGTFAVLVALTYGGPIWLSFVLVVFWGITIVPDSAQFSALVADSAPAELTGSLLTLQTALGFTLTIFTVQLAPWLAGQIGWPGVMLVLVIGPAAGIVSMRQFLKTD